jgi:hypothetical protein
VRWWRDGTDRLAFRLWRLLRRHPTGMPAPQPWSGPPDPSPDPAREPPVRAAARPALPSIGEMLLALAPRLDWTDPVLRRGLAEPVWTPPPDLRALIERARDEAGQMPLYELGMSLPTHTLVLACLALLRSREDAAIDALPCPEAGGAVRDIPGSVQTAMFLAFGLIWPPRSADAPVEFVRPSPVATPVNAAQVPPVLRPERSPTSDPPRIPTIVRPEP